jgi:peptidoglycan-N-acetylglucosamine deacetylase
MFTFRTTTIIFFILLLGLNLLSIAIQPVHFGFYLLLIWLYLSVSVLMSFFIRSGFHRKALCNLDTTRKVVALTFDDGPHPEITVKILDLLRNRATATFFCKGMNIEGNEPILRKMNLEGHLIGNHSWSHSDWFDFYPPRKMREELIHTDAKIGSVIGKKPLLFRPPYGVINPMLKKALSGLPYHVIGFSNRCWDTVAKDEKKVLGRVKKNLRPGDVILLHDTVENSVNILKDLLDHLDEEGYSVVPLDKLFNVEAYEK